jgi:hypothetical protein
MASRRAWPELTAPVAAQHLGEFTKASERVTITFNLRSQHWWMEATFAFGAPALPIGFGQFTDVLTLNLKVVAVETAALHARILMGHGLALFTFSPLITRAGTRTQRKSV